MTKIVIKRSLESRNKELLSLKTNKTKWINEEVGRLREAVISSSLGQEYVYRKKLEQANLYNSGVTSDLVFLEKEAIYRGISLQEMANLVITADQYSSNFLSNLELLRVDFKDRVNVCNSKQEIDQVLEEFEQRLLIYEN